MGILVYEMLVGIPPFYSSSVNNMYRKAIKEKVVFKPNVKISKEAKDLIVKLLRKSAKRRLGSQADSLEVLSHPFFKKLDWTQLLARKLKAPFLPEITGEKWL